MSSPSDLNVTADHSPSLAPPEAQPPGQAATDRGQRYQLYAELGRGGMGAVLHGYDTDLDRELAIKVMLDSHRDRPDLVRRFLQEARIHGQLQHPGVAPVHELGRLADGRPFFAMKLVAGRNLAALLKERADPGQELPRWLKVFEQVCETLAYAHSKGVIHRDLKPANVMVGGFGEVQVMDWGLACRLDRGAAAAGERPAAPAGQSAAGLDTAALAAAVMPDTDPARLTQAGCAVGTPAYMAPEQARGELARLDTRCDVFGLGAILCEILTGQPPYTGKDYQEVVDRARQGELGEAFARLEQCGADEPLLGLARACLAAEPANRPPDATAVAEAITAYLASVQERLRAAEIDRAAAHARAAEARKRQRLTLALAATVVLLMGLGGGAAWWVQREQAAREAERTRQHTESARRQADARKVVSAALHDAGQFQQQGRYPEALALLGQARSRLAGAGNPDALGKRVATLEGDVKMRAALDEARVRLFAPGKEERLDYEAADAAYEKAFREFFGYQALRDLKPDAARARVQSSAIADWVIAGLDDWGHMKASQGQSLQALLRWALAEVVDADPWRRRFRARAKSGDAAGLKRLARDPAALAQPPITSLWLSDTLAGKGALPETVEVLRRARVQYPDDFWINYQLAFRLGQLKSSPLEEAVGYSRVALALRPRFPGSYLHLGQALAKQGRLAEARATYQKGLALKADSATLYLGLGEVLLDEGQWQEALKAFERAVQERPGLAAGHRWLGIVRAEQKQFRKAIAALDRAVQLDPKDAYAHFGLGIALMGAGEFQRALEPMRKRLALLGPTDPRRERAQWAVGLVNRLAALGARLPAYLHNETRPADTDERLTLAQVYEIRDYPAAGATQYAQAFKEQPHLADDLTATHRFAAARAAARAGLGLGKDGAGVPEDDRARWRRQALAWLQADLLGWTRVMAKGASEGRAVAQELQGWKRNPDLSGLRGPALDRLPAEERNAWQEFWADVDELLRVLEPCRTTPPLPYGFVASQIADDPTYGYLKNNPILLGGKDVKAQFAASRIYLEHLRDGHFKPFQFKRLRNVGRGPSGGIVDLWELTVSDGTISRLYIDLYHPDRDPLKTSAPRGMYFAR